MRIQDDLRARVRAGEWKADGMLPSRRSLASEYKVDLGTLQRAIAALLEDGTLRADEGRGTYIAESSAHSVQFQTSASSPVGQPGVHSRRISATGTMGIVAEIIPNPQYDNPDGISPFWIGEAVLGLERTFQGAGGATRLFNRLTPNGPVSDFHAIASLLEAGINALAVILPDEAPGAIAQALAAARDITVPLVFISDKPIKGAYTHVFYDQQTNGYQAAQHLIRCGYRRLLFLFPFQSSWVTERIEGITDALEIAGLSGDALAVHVGDRQDLEMVEPAREMAKRLFEAGAIDGCGVIAGNDFAAHGIMLAAAEAGRVPGRDFGLVGFDDLPASRELGLTTVRPPFAGMAEQVAMLLAHALQGEEMPVQVRMRPHLVARASSFAMPAARRR